MTGFPVRSLGRLLSPVARRPVYLLLFLTSRCECACGHCFYWRRTNRPEEPLSLEEVRRLARSLGPMVQITLTGGSPDLREDLPEIAVCLARDCRPMNMTLCSNGNDPARLQRHVGRILASVPDLRLTVDISLDGLGDVHDSIRRTPGLFGRVVKSYEALQGFRRTHPNFRLGAGLCVSGLNSQTALQTARWASTHLPLDNLTPVLVRGDTREPRARRGDPEVFLAIAREVARLLSGGGLRGYAGFTRLISAKDIVQKELIAEIFRTGRSPLRCNAAREVTVVYPDGTVPGCELRPEVLGYLRDVDMDIRRIWRGHAIRDFRRRIRAERCCCWHQCFMSAAIVKTPRLWPRLLAAAWQTRRAGASRAPLRSTS